MSSSSIVQGDAFLRYGLRGDVGSDFRRRSANRLEVSTFSKREECEGGLYKNCERTPGLDDVGRSIGIEELQIHQLFLLLPMFRNGGLNAVFGA